LLAHNAITSPVTVPANFTSAVIVDFATQHPAQQSVYIGDPGCVVMGAAYKWGPAGVGTARLVAGYYGYGSTFTFGYVSAYENYSALIQTDLSGAVAMGRAAAGGGDATIQAYSMGAMASGAAVGYNATALISAGNAFGARAHGFVNSSTISAAKSGAVAFGSAIYGYRIFANSYGGMAIGYAYTADVEATGYSNCFQFGEGTNALQDSFQIGNAGLRLKGTTGAPAAPQNGDVWEAGGDIFVRTGGVSKNMSNIV
jgi:hypothetical protein